MKSIVNALVIVLLLYCFIIGYVSCTTGSSLSCYDYAVSSFPTMGYSKDQLFSIRNTCLYDSQGYVSVLKKNGIFKYSGPRGCRSGIQCRNKIHKISSVITNHDTQSSSNKSHDGVTMSNLTKVDTGGFIPPKQDKKVSVSLVNAQSLNNKTQVFLDYVTGIKTDLCVVTETFLTDLSTVTRAAIQPDGYFFVDQPISSGEACGGTGLWYRDCFKVSRLSYGQKSSFEFSEWLVQWSNKRLKLCILYHPPYSQSNPISNGTFLDEFDEYLDCTVLCDELLCIMGDFNIHMNKPQDVDQIRLSSMLKSYGLVNHVDIPTHRLGNTLDLIITRDNDELSFSKPSAGYMLSDHFFVTTKLGFPKPDLTVKSVTYRNT